MKDPFRPASLLVVLLNNQILSDIVYAVSMSLYLGLYASLTWACYYINMFTSLVGDNLVLIQDVFTFPAYLKCKGYDVANYMKEQDQCDLMRVYGGPLENETEPAAVLIHVSWPEPDSLVQYLRISCLTILAGRVFYPFNIVRINYP